MKKLGNYLGKGLGAIVFLVFLYLLAAFAGSVIPVNMHQDRTVGDIEIYLRTNGVHTSLVLPVSTEIIDWSEIVEFEHARSGREDFRYLSFGWGDLEFYKNTPEWSDLTPSIALRALFLESPSALNVEFHDLVPDDPSIIAVRVSEQQYLDLSQYIQDSFEYDKNGEVRQVMDLHYNQRDVFYQATGSLNLFYTCNTWTNNALKSSDLKACLWTPFDKGIFYQYR